MLSSLMVTFQRIAPRSWRETFLGFKNAKKLLEISTKRIYNYKFPKVNAVRKGRSGIHDEEQVCLKLSQAEGNIRPSWSFLYISSHKTKVS